MEVTERIRKASANLTATERRIAEVVLRSPQTVAFGTVALIASQAGAGTATVVRLATKLGYDGYVDMQRSVQHDVAGQLGPAAERIRSVRDDGSGGTDAPSRHRDTERHNLEHTLDVLEPEAVSALVEKLGDESTEVFVLSGSSSRGVALQFVHDLGHLRGRVELLDGNQVDLLQKIALADEGAIVIAIDLRRYDQWLVDALAVISGRGLDIVSVTDSVISPLGAHASHTFVVAADSIGPFDSHVGTLALLNLVVIEVARAASADATHRLDRLEQAWTDSDALGD